ncbi:hypothetical protein BY458DRAFT_506048 [Sporodiniella umbellata]|nr:hypothetical protein BY458DRAFT_506048 [Sporodiniella umbellata]
MEQESKEAPILCKAGCGFYGNPGFDDMCSKCFKETSQKQRKRVRSPTPEPNNNKERQLLSDSSDHPVDYEKKREEMLVPLQTNKGKCYNCRKKVPLAKQAANKCRCGFVFCDTHKYPDRHSCNIDFVKMDREILAKNNPKLHERPKGGRSFQRIDSL